MERPLDPIVIQMSPLHPLTLWFHTIHFNIIFLSVQKSPELSFPLIFSNQILYMFCIATMHAVCPFHLILHNLITLTI